MTKFFLRAIVFILVVVPFHQARGAFIIPIPSLDVTVAVKDSVYSQSIFIQDNSGKVDYRGLNLAINTMIQNHTLYCRDSGINKWLGSQAGCDFVGFHPSLVRAVPYNTIFNSSKDATVALAIRGVTGTSGLTQPKFFYIRLQYLIGRYKMGRLLGDEQMERSILTDQTYQVEQINLDRYFPSAG